MLATIPEVEVDATAQQQARVSRATACVSCFLTLIVILSFLHCFLTVLLFVICLWIFTMSSRRTVSEGFEVASSDNLPVGDADMLNSFYVAIMNFISAEVRNVKPVNWLTCIFYIYV